MLLLAAGILAYNLIGFTWETPPRSPGELLQEAMGEGESEAARARRRQAARELVGQAKTATDELRRLANESDDPAVRAAALQGLGKARDKDSLRLLLRGLEDPNSRVRGQANSALMKIFQADLGFRAYDPPNTRAAAVERWRDAVERSSPSQ